MPWKSYLVLWRALLGDGGGGGSSALQVRPQDHGSSAVLAPWNA